MIKKKLFHMRHIRRGDYDDEDKLEKRKSEKKFFSLVSFEVRSVDMSL